MARKSEASGESWKSPPSGYHNRLPDQYVRFVVEFARGASLPGASLQPILRSLITLLGDHVVELHSLNEPKWSENLPWRQTSSCSYGLKLPLSRIADPDTWQQLVHSFTEYRLSISARRGGGARRHTVWELNYGWRAHLCHSFDLTIATRHLDRERVEDFQATALTFFRALGNTPGVIGGYGEIVEHSRDTYEIAEPVHGSDRWLTCSLLADELSLDHEALVVPRWITLLTPRHIEQLGGLGRLRASLVNSVTRMEGRTKGVLKACDEYLIELEPKPAIAMVILQDFRSILVSIDFHRWDPALPDVARWFLDELAVANVLATTRHDRVLRRLKQIEIDRERAKEIDRAHQLRIARESGRLPKKPKPGTIPANDYRTRPPRCIQGTGTLDTKLPKVRDMNDRAVAFRLQPRGLEKALTIYGRASRESESLVSPILVGSLDNDRAALYFDTRIHGFDGEQSSSAPDKARPIGKLKQFACPRCQGRLFDCWAAFEHNDEDGVLSPEDEARRQDFFDWFYLIAKCVSCNKTALAADIECA